jgi:chemotaxis protein CheC
LVGNAASILVSAYLASVGRLADLSVLPGRTSFAFDMVGAILDAVAAEIGLVADEAIVIKTEFESNDAEEDEATVDAYLLFLPDEAGLQALLERLGLA